MHYILKAFGTAKGLLDCLSVSTRLARCLAETADARSIALMSQVFAPTSLRVTFESEGPGAFTREQVEEMVVKDANGAVTELRLPNKMVIVANHQVCTVSVSLELEASIDLLRQNSTDWIYMWTLTYFMNVHTDVLIVLKNSLKWIPILGWVRVLRVHSSPAPA